MGLLTQRKEHRVPDLSRYDYYYQQRDDYGKSRQLSASAAYAASRSREAPVPVQQRSYSLTQPSQARKVVRTRRRANSKGPHEVKEVPRASHNRTKLQESNGRTKSITRKTIRRINGVDYVETITTTPLEDEDNVHYFNEFSDPVDAYVENERPVRRIRRIRKTAPSSPRSVRSQRSPISPQRSVRSRQGDEYQYEDTRIAGLNYGTTEPIERTASPVVRRATKSRPVRSKSTRSTRRVYSNPTSPAEIQGGKKRMTEQEMYAKALEIAQRNVYKNSDFPPEVLNGTGNQQEEQGYSKMGQRSFRNGSGRGKKRFNLFHKDKNVRAPPPPLPPVDVPRASRASHASHVSSLDNRLEQSIDRSSARSTSTASRRNLSDEEMYAQALAISQSKAQRSSEELEAATQPLDLGGIERPVRSPHSNAPSFFTPAQTINENSEEKFEDADSEWKDARSRVEASGNYNYSAEDGDHYDFEESETPPKLQQKQRRGYTPETEDEAVAKDLSGHGPEATARSGSELKPENYDVEPQSEAESELVPQSEPESELVPQSEPESELVPQSEPESEPESGPGSERQAASELLAGSQREPEPEVEFEPETEPEVEFEPEPEPEAEAEFEPEPEPEAEAEFEPEAEAEAEAEFEPEPEAEAEAEFEPESEAEPEPEAELEPEPESEAESKPEPEVDSEPEPETEVGPETEPEVELENGHEFESETGPEAGPEAKSKSKSSEKLMRRDAETALEYHPEEISQAYEVGVDEMRRNRLSSLSKNGDLVPTIRNSADYSRRSIVRNEDAVPSARNSVAYSRKSRLIRNEDLAPPRNSTEPNFSRGKDVNPPKRSVTRSSRASPENRFHNHIASPEEVAAGDLQASNAKTPVSSPLHLQTGRKQREQSIDNSVTPTGFASEAEVGGLGADGYSSAPAVDGSPDAPTTSGRKHRGFRLSRFKTKKRYSANNRPNDEFVPDLPKASSVQPGLRDSGIGYASPPTWGPPNYDEGFDNRPKGKFRSLFDKMVEFGAENSGYQPSHEEKEQQRAAELEANSWRLNDNTSPIGLSKGASPDAVAASSDVTGAATANGAVTANGAAAGTEVNSRMGPAGTSGGAGRRTGGSTHPWRRNLQSLKSNTNRGDANLEEAPAARNSSNFLGAPPAGDRDDASSNYEEYADEAYKDGYIDGVRDSQCERRQETAKKINGTRGNSTVDMGMEDKFRYARNSSLGEKAVTKAENEAQNRGKEQKGGLFKKLFKK